MVTVDNIKKIIIAILFFLVCIPVKAFAFWGIPDIENLNNLKLVSATQVYDVNGKLISKLFE